jgi:hypothetical protein
MSFVNGLADGFSKGMKISQDAKDRKAERKLRDDRLAELERNEEVPLYSKGGKVRSTGAGCNPMKKGR